MEGTGEICRDELETDRLEEGVYTFQDCTWRDGVLMQSNSFVYLKFQNIIRSLLPWDFVTVAAKDKMHIMCIWYTGLSIALAFATAADKLQIVPYESCNKGDRIVIQHLCDSQGLQTITNACNNVQGHLIVQRWERLRCHITLKIQGCRWYYVREMYSLLHWHHQYVIFKTIVRDYELLWSYSYYTIGTLACHKIQFSDDARTWTTTDEEVY